MPPRGTDHSLTAGRQEKVPVVHVAMATFNGRRWIESQIRSIFRQEGVEVRLVVSDDGSTDGTREWLEELAASDPRVTLLPPREGEAGVGENFLYTLVNLHPGEHDFVAFSDQDDLWAPTKLSRQVGLIAELGVEAVSSNVYAFRQTSGGVLKKTLIRKDNPQVEWDFIFEAPGTGSSFLMTEGAWRLVRDHVQRWGTKGIWLHDWYVYALVRAAGMKWFIDSEPLVAYRQHEGNALGAHRGVEAIRRRTKNLLSGKYGRQFLKVHEASMRVATDNGRDPEFIAGLEQLGTLLRDGSMKARWALMKDYKKIRRRPSEGFSLAVARVLGIW